MNEIKKIRIEQMDRWIFLDVQQHPQAYARKSRRNKKKSREQKIDKSGERWEGGGRENGREWQLKSLGLSVIQLSQHSHVTQLRALSHLYARQQVQYPRDNIPGTRIDPLAADM